jgi:hypothetical protein
MRNVMLALIVFSVLAPPALAATVGGPESVRLIVRAEETEVAAGYPVVLHASLTVPNDAIQAPVFSPGAGNVDVFIKDPATSVQSRYLGPGWGIEERPPALVAVANDLPLDGSVTMLFHNAIDGRTDLAPVALPLVPGQYAITVEYRGLGVDKPVSGSVRVIVREPATDGERAYWKAMQADPRLAAALQLGNFRRHRELLAQAEQLVQAYPESAHSAFAALALGRHYLHVSHDAARAKQILTLAAGRQSNRFLRSQAQYELASALIVLGDREAARSTIEQALIHADDRALSEELRRLRMTLQQ